MTTVIYNTDITGDKLSGKPYLRASREAEQILDTNWTRIVYNGTYEFNANTFPESDTPGIKRVDWDTTNNLFTFNRSTVAPYAVIVGFEVEGGLRPSSIDLRFVIPSPTPIYFPLPRSAQYLELKDIARRERTTMQHIEIVRTTSVLTQYGLGVELRSDLDGIIQSPKVVDAVIQIYPL